MLSRRSPAAGADGAADQDPRRRECRALRLAVPGENAVDGSVVVKKPHAKLLLRDGAGDGHVAVAVNAAATRIPQPLVMFRC